MPGTGARLTALSRWHVHQGFTDPTSTPTVRKTLAGIARTHGRPKKKAKALPIEDLELIVVRLSSLLTLKTARDNALLQVGFFGGFRRSELVAIKEEHLRWTPEGIEILLPRSKTDQTGEGMVKAIPYSDGPCCPAKALRAWLDAAGIAAGRAFRSVSKWGAMSESALSVGSVNTILADCATLAQLDYVPDLSPWHGHQRPPRRRRLPRDQEARRLAPRWDGAGLHRRGESVRGERRRPLASITHETSLRFVACSY